MQSKPKKLPVSAIAAAAFPVVTDLPPQVYDGIGRIVSAHGVLETQVSDFLFEMAEIDFPIGRVTFRYQAASERFKIVKKLIVMHGLEPPLNLNELLDQITSCCNARDQFAHGVWVTTPEGRLALRVTRGEYEIPDGIADRSFIPEAMFVPDEYYEQTQHVILTTAAAVNRLKLDLVAVLKARHGST